MYAVIFRAELNEIDDSYAAIADRMRELAMNEFGCTAYTSCMEGNNEITISYWPGKEAIQAWKNNPEHQQAQDRKLAGVWGGEALRFCKMQALHLGPALHQNAISACTAVAQKSTKLCQTGPNEGFIRFP